MTYDKYTKASGSLKLTFSADYLDTLSVDDHEVEFIFSDGTAKGTLTILEASTAATGGTKASEGTVKPTSGTNGSGSKTNGSSVKTGSTEMALIFVVILVMAAGIIIFSKKRKND